MAKYVDGGDIDLDKEIVLRGDGTRITEADAEAQGLEIANRGRTGRPSLSGGAKHSPQVGVRVSEELHSKLAAKAEAEGKRVSDIVREAIESYV